MMLRLIYMGSPTFAVGILDSLLAAGHEVVAVYAQPPRPAGRGLAERKCPVHVFAESRGLTVRTPRHLREPAEQSAFASLGADLAIVAACGLILPKPVLEAPRLGCINVHASLLPRWRGAAPIQHAILAGDATTGVTIMQMDPGLDTGPMLLTETVPIASDTTAAALEETLAQVGARLVVRAIDELAAGHLTATPQPATGATYASKLTSEIGRLDWTQPAVDLARRIRALNPAPGTWFEHQKQRIKVLAAEVEPGRTASPPGTYLGDGFVIACGDGALRLTLVQRAGRAAIAAEEFLRGFRVAPGMHLG